MTKKNKAEGITIEQLIQKKLEKDKRREATKEIEVEKLGVLLAHNPSDTQRIEFADKTKSGSYADMMAAYERLVYDCCPILHSKELQSEIGVQYPYDTVRAIFSVEEVAQIGVELLNFFEADGISEAEEGLKN